MMYGWGDNGPSWWMMAINGLFIVGLLVAIVGVVVWAVRQSTSTAATTTAETPRGILEMRFARGEIDADELRARLAVLERPSGEGKGKPA